MQTASSPRRLVRTGATSALVAVLAFGATAGARASAKAGSNDVPVSKPNIVVIMTDDQTAESLRVMPKVHSLIAKQGTTFEQSIVSWSLCCPSRATYLTGQYATNHGVWGNVLPWGSYDAFKHQDTTFPAALQATGYETIHVGKYLNRYGLARPLTAPPGWSRWYGTIDPSTYKYFGFSMLENGRKVTYPRQDSQYQTDVETDLAVSAIRRQARRDRPFFLNVAYLAPHNDVREGRSEDQGRAVPAPRDAGTFSDEPLPRTPSFDEADVSRKPQAIRALPRLSEKSRARMKVAYDAYLESLLAVDDGVGRIVKTLRTTGKLANTFVIFTSDNGYLFGEHRIESGKVWFYEPSIRVPLLMRGPGVRRAAATESLVANIDLAPTILDLADATPLREMDGRSLVPLLQAESAPDDRAVLLQSGSPYTPTFGIRTPKYVYIEYTTGERELYDLRSDPDQLTNLVDDPALAPVQADLAQRLAKLETCAGASCNDDIVTDGSPASTP